MSDAFNDYLDALENGIVAEVPPEEVEVKEDNKTVKKSVSKLILPKDIQTPKEITDKPLEGEYEPSSENTEPQSDKHQRDEQIMFAEELMKRAETHFEEDWLKLYLEAQQSKKTNYIAQKMRSGKFRLNEQHTVEILSEIDIYGKSANEILDKNYD